jgi:hypothetical protein
VTSCSAKGPSRTEALVVDVDAVERGRGSSPAVSPSAGRVVCGAFATDAGPDVVGGLVGAPVGAGVCTGVCGGAVVIGVVASVGVGVGVAVGGIRGIDVGGNDAVGDAV